MFVPSAAQHRFSAVMHLAGLKAVGESVQQPLEYYKVNLTGTIRLLEVSGAQARSLAGGGRTAADLRPMLKGQSGMLSTGGCRIRARWEGTRASCGR